MVQRLKNIYHLFVSILANVIMKFPSRNLTVIGVTGTDGKTTTVNMIYHILKTAGLTVSMISTVGAIIDDQNYDIGFHVTTPNPFHIQRFMQQALAVVSPGRKYMVLEVTSHAIDQNRIWGIPFTIGVLTNITPEHLDYHKTLARYTRTKVKLLQRSMIAIVNRDDDSFTTVMKYLAPHKNVLHYAIEDDRADITTKKFTYNSILKETYNHSNMLAAITVCKALGVSDRKIREAIATFTPPIGRGEIVYDKKFTVMIDFAHTPNAFEQVLAAVRPLAKGKLIHVFGAAGERDVMKRPQMGKFSAQQADVLILTSEDPRSEDPEKIMDDLLRGISKEQRKKIEIYKIIDRKEAIKKAISLAKEGDFILLTGKAHEQSMNYGKGEEVWNEYKAVTDAIGTT